MYVIDVAVVVGYLEMCIRDSLYTAWNFGSYLCCHLFCSETRRKTGKYPE